VAAGKGAVLRPTTTSCSVRIGSRAIRTVRSYRGGRVSCSFAIPAATHRGAVIRGLLIVVVGRQRVPWSFSAWVR
jgi:hypothetical protein